MKLMADDDDQGGEKTLKSLDLSKLHPKLTYDDHEYVSRLDTMGALKEIQKRFGEEVDAEPDEFAEAVIANTLIPSGSEKPVGEQRAQEMLSDPAFLEAYLTAHPTLYSERRKSDENGKTELKIHVERGENETAQEFFLRAYRNQQQRRAERWKELARKMQVQFGGLTSVLSNSGLSALIESNKASSRINDIIAGKPSSSMADIWRQDRLGGTIEPIKPAELSIPEHPAHETNRRLSDVARSIDELRELFVEQASMQQNLNTVATEILNNFVTGSKAAERNSKRALLVAVAAVLVTAGTFVYSQFFDDDAELQLAKQEEVANILKDLRENSVSESELSQRQIDLLERSIVEQERQSEASERASRSPQP